MKITYNSCIICSGKPLSTSLTVKDHSVSAESFDVVECPDCSLRITQDVENVNEIGKYYQSSDYISHSDTNKGIVNKLYHLVRERTLNGKKSLVIRSTTKKIGNILDIGAGTGAFLKVMKNGNWNITGLEPDTTARKNALELNQINLLNNDELFQLPAESFDAITMWHVLEHVHTLNEYLGQLKKLIKPKGKIFIAVPNYTSYDAAIYHEFWAAYDVPRHLYHFSPNAMRSLLKKHGLRLINIRPMWYDSFYVSLLSEKYKTGKNNFIKAFITGLKSNIKALSNNEKASSLIYIIGI